MSGGDCGCALGDCARIGAPCDVLNCRARHELLSGAAMSGNATRRYMAANARKCDCPPTWLVVFCAIIGTHIGRALYEAWK